jgi:hypothetical protein
VAAGVIVILVAAFVGWRLVTSDTTYDPDTPLADQCDDVPSGASRVTVKADDGRTLGAALVGPRTASVGVVLRQGAGQTICDWLPWAGGSGRRPGHASCSSTGEVAAAHRARVTCRPSRAT